jgi:hypothetical protein
MTTVNITIGEGGEPVSITLPSLPGETVGATPVFP